jgi:hypothetical protein
VELLSCLADESTSVPLHAYYAATAPAGPSLLAEPAPPTWQKVWQMVGQLLQALCLSAGCRAPCPATEPVGQGDGLLV